MILAVPVLVICLLAGQATAEELNVSVTATVAEGEYWIYTMFLDEGQEVRIDLAVTGGVGDFYFVDGSGLSQFLSITADGGTSGWDYYPSMSALDVSSLEAMDTFSAAGAYHVVLFNDGSSTLELSGTIEAVYPTSLFSIVIVIVAIAVAVLLILIFVFTRQTRRMQQTVDAYELHRAPPVPQRTQHAHAGAGHGSYLDRSGNRCPRCGALMVPGAAFCKQCGARVGP